MKKIIFLIIASLSINYANSQITKGFWMFGGTGRIISGSTTLLNTQYKSTAINLNPRVGYFFINKLSAGLRLNYDYQKTVDGGGFPRSSQAFGAGPFIRYYFLKNDSRINLISELNGGFNKPTDSKNINYEFEVLGGIVLFLNSTVAVEILPGYNSYTTTGAAESKSKNFILNIGLQVHLQKE